MKTNNADKPEPEDATHDTVLDFNEEPLDITLVRVMRGQIKVKNKPEDVNEKMIGTETCDVCA